MGMNQNELIEKFGIDRVLHFAFGGWLACFGPTWYYAIAIALIVGIGKELVDKFIRRTKYDIYDTIATIAGGCVTALFMVFF